MSNIHIGKNGTMSFNGADATNLYRASMIKQGIRLHRDTGMLLTRGATITKLFGMASEYTGQKYKRGQHDLAIADMTAWIDAAKASITITTDKE
jgi:hypothetical protein